MSTWWRSSIATGVGLATNAVVISTGASVFTLSVVLLLLGVQTR